MRAVTRRMLRAASGRTCERSVRSWGWIELDGDADGLARRADEPIDDRRQSLERRYGGARDVRDVRAREDNDRFDRRARRVDRHVSTHTHGIPARALRRRLALETPADPVLLLAVP